MLLAWLGGRPPAARSLDARSELFSAARAMTDVRAIGAAPHPTGSAAIEDVRAYVLQRLAAVGVPAEIHTGSAAASPPGARQILAAADVQNVVGMLPGRDRGAPAVLVMAHYDSVNNSSGAADDGAGVAALIEIARSLAADARAHGPAGRDVIFLATDSEEVELLGAHAFFRSDPLARRVGVAVNLEARGDAGRAAMFQTGPHDGAAIRLYARLAERPYANAFTGFVASVLPNDTDFSVALTHGVGGYNFAFIDDQLAYHSPVTTPAHLDPRSLQNLGGQALPLVRGLAGARALPAPSADWSYADVFGRAVIGYPAVVGGWLVLLLAGALAGIAAWRARRAGLLDARDTASGAATTGASFTAAAVALHVSGRTLPGGATGVYGLLVRYDLLFLGSALLFAGVALLMWALAARARGRAAAAVALLVLGVAGSMFGGFDATGLGLGLLAAGLAWIALARAPSVWGAWFGALAVAFALATLVQLIAPPAALIFGWPLLLAAAGALAVFGSGRPRSGLVAAAGLAVLALALVGGWAAGVFAALGATTPEALAVMILPAAAALAPFIRLWAGRRLSGAVASALIVTGAALLAFVASAGGTRDRPHMTEAFYLSRPAETRAWRIAPGDVLDAWTTRVLKLDGRPPRRTTLDDGGLFGGRRVWAAAAPVQVAAAPDLTTTYDAGRLVITVRPPGRVRSLTVALGRGAGLTDPRLNARPVDWPLARDAPAAVVYAASPAEGFTLSFAAPAHGALAITATTLSDGWPAGLAPPRPPPTLAAWRGSDTTRVQAVREVRW